MKSTKIALLVVVFVAAAIMVASAQTQVFVPGNASGCFGSSFDVIVPLTPALTVGGPGTITVTYVSGTVNLGGPTTGPNGIFWNEGSGTGEFPLQEAIGVGGGEVNTFGALMGAFVPQWRANAPGFTAIDGTKGAARVGIMPNTLFFIGTEKTFNVTQAGTLFLGINDSVVADNTGGFTVTVSVQ